LENLSFSPAPHAHLIHRNTGLSGRDLRVAPAIPDSPSVFINGDESGLHHDYEVWLERLAPHAPIDQAGLEAADPFGRVHSHSGEVYPERNEGTTQTRT
jgi:hypothetical protein